jgi:DNA-directed RNA polymerase specialized sigma24 family protein
VLPEQALKKVGSFSPVRYVSIIGAVTEREFLEMSLPHLARLASLARRLCGDVDEADDLVQETFIRALGARRQLRSSGSVLPWMIGILRRLFLDSRRGAQRRLELVRSEPMLGAEPIGDLEEIRSVLAKGKEPYWTGEVGNQERMARAWIALGEGDKKTAEALMKQAADAEDATEKHPVTPGPIVPARELYADMLLELGQPAAALANYDQSLARSPGRFAALAGAARAALRAGKKDQAREHYAKLVALAAHGDDSRPELAEARAFLAKK